MTTRCDRLVKNDMNHCSILPPIPVSLKVKHVGPYQMPWIGIVFRYLPALSLYMYACMYVWMYVHLYIRMYACTYTYVRTYVCNTMCVSVYIIIMYAWLCTYVRMYVCIYSCQCTGIMYHLTMIVVK